MKKHLLTLTLSSILAIPVVSHAEFKGGFADIGVHYLDWTSRTTEKSSTKSHKDDFGYLEFEGGAKEGANKQVISSQADSLIKISRIWADFFPANTSNQPI